VCDKGHGTCNWGNYKKAGACSSPALRPRVRLAAYGSFRLCEGSPSSCANNFSARVNRATKPAGALQGSRLGCLKLCCKDSGSARPVGQTNYEAARFSPPAHSTPRSRLIINFLDINFVAINQKINSQPISRSQTRSGRPVRLCPVRFRALAVRPRALRRFGNIILHLRRAKIEPLATRHTARRTQADHRHQPV
jgi:hypothetical protein